MYRLRREVSYLTVSLSLWPLQAPHTVLDGNLLQEGVALRLGKVRRLQLTKVELHGAVVADNVRKEGLAVQTVLADAKGLSGLGSVLGEGHDHLIVLKVLSERNKERLRKEFEKKI